MMIPSTCLGRPGAEEQNRYREAKGCVIEIECTVVCSTTSYKHTTCTHTKFSMQLMKAYMAENIPQLVAIG